MYEPLLPSVDEESTSVTVESDSDSTRTLSTCLLYTGEGSTSNTYSAENLSTPTESSSLLRNGTRISNLEIKVWSAIILLAMFAGIFVIVYMIIEKRAEHE